MQVKIPHNLKLLMTGQHHTPITLFMREKFTVHIGHGVGKKLILHTVRKGKILSLQGIKLRKFKPVTR
jgi:hypothetical protein